MTCIRKVGQEDRIDFAVRKDGLNRKTGHWTVDTSSETARGGKPQKLQEPRFGE